MATAGQSPKRLTRRLWGKVWTTLSPIFTSYIANCGAHAMVPREVLKDYVGRVIDDTYGFFALPTDKDPIQ